MPRCGCAPPRSRASATISKRSSSSRAANSTWSNCRTIRPPLPSSSQTRCGSTPPRSNRSSSRRRRRNGSTSSSGCSTRRHGGCALRTRRTRAAKAMTTTMTSGPRPLRYGSRSTDPLDASIAIEALQRRLGVRPRVEHHDEGARRAAVLIPIVSAPAGLQLLCFERTDEVLEHKGEICLPGGSIEEDDRDVVDAALREAREELGIDPASVRVLGLLDDVHTVVSNYIITPVAGFIKIGRAHV